ncbi:hypothetical protein EDC04DRAFT_165762 [Pisolithus marmoratus]|nr:hypothetical protein EDC04DRAFT_165762 [Pisolithus marmoratus]
MSKVPCYLEPDGLGPPLLPNDALREGPPSQGSLEVDVQEPAGMEAFTSMLRDPTLSKYEKKSQLGRQLLKLIQRQYVDSLGLNISDPFELHHEHSLDHGTSSSSKLSKSDKVERIKDRLLDMLSKGTWFTLRALALVYSRERPREKWVCSDELADWSSPQA